MYDGGLSNSKDKSDIKPIYIKFESMTMSLAEDVVLSKLNSPSPNCLKLVVNPSRNGVMPVEKELKNRGKIVFSQYDNQKLAYINQINDRSPGIMSDISSRRDYKHQKTLGTPNEYNKESKKPIKSVLRKGISMSNIQDHENGLADKVNIRSKPELRVQIIADSPPQHNKDEERSSNKSRKSSDSLQVPSANNHMHNKLILIEPKQALDYEGPHSFDDLSQNDQEKRKSDECLNYPISIPDSPVSSKSTRGRQKLQRYLRHHPSAPLGVVSEEQCTEIYTFNRNSPEEQIRVVERRSPMPTGGASRDGSVVSRGRLTRQNSAILSVRCLYSQERTDKDLQGYRQEKEAELAKTKNDANLIRQITREIADEHHQKEASQYQREVQLVRQSSRSVDLNADLERITSSSRRKIRIKTNEEEVTPIREIKTTSVKQINDTVNPSKAITSFERSILTNNEKPMRSDRIYSQATSSNIDSLNANRHEFGGTPFESPCPRVFSRLSHQDPINQGNDIGRFLNKEGPTKEKLQYKKLSNKVEKLQVSFESNIIKREQNIISNRALYHTAERLNKLSERFGKIEGVSNRRLIDIDDLLDELETHLQRLTKEKVKVEEEKKAKDEENKSISIKVELLEEAIAKQIDRIKNPVKKSSRILAKKLQRVSKESVINGPGEKSKGSTFFEGSPTSSHYLINGADHKERDANFQSSPNNVRYSDGGRVRNHSSSRLSQSKDIINLMRESARLTSRNTQDLQIRDYLHRSTNVDSRNFYGLIKAQGKDQLTEMTTYFDYSGVGASMDATQIDPISKLTSTIDQKNAVSKLKRLSQREKVQIQPRDSKIRCDNSDHLKDLLNRHSQTSPAATDYKNRPQYGQTTRENHKLTFGAVLSDLTHAKHKPPSPYITALRRLDHVPDNVKRNPTLSSTEFKSKLLAHILN